MNGNPWQIPSNNSDLTQPNKILVLIQQQRSNFKRQRLELGHEREQTAGRAVHGPLCQVGGGKWPASEPPWSSSDPGSLMVALSTVELGFPFYTVFSQGDLEIIPIFVFWLISCSFLISRTLFSEDRTYLFLQWVIPFLTLSFKISRRCLTLASQVFAGMQQPWGQGHIWEIQPQRLLGIFLPSVGHPQPLVVRPSFYSHF